ncbi:hypothetical protein ZTR_01269 [Talaromyces verruculosus]|nr:hypothetical protein ZTR_01269 [Talaromyces verruculosus]
MAGLPKRIIKETERLMAEPVPGINAVPHEDNLRYFDVTIHGPAQSPYEGGIFRLELFLPDDYPMTPPKIRFLTKIYHPNIDRLGRICLDVLKNNWSPALQIRTILLSIQALLGAPNPDDPLANDVAQRWKEDEPAAIQTAKDELARTTIDIIGKRVEPPPTKKRFPSRLFDNHFNPPNDKSTGNASPAFKMRTYDDSFSGQKIYPGKGKLYVRGDSKIFRFQNGKSESLFLQRKNPRRISWTILYRRQHRKGISEEVAKKRTRRVVKSQRAIVGASLDVIKERRSQRPEARAAARQQAIKDAKEKKAASESKKKAEKAKSAASASAGKGRIQSKQGAKGAPIKVQAKSR